jgi:hypothetical protein
MHHIQLITGRLEPVFASSSRKSSVFFGLQEQDGIPVLSEIEQDGIPVLSEKAERSIADIGCLTTI